MTYAPNRSSAGLSNWPRTCSFKTAKHSVFVNTSFTSCGAAQPQVKPQDVDQRKASEKLKSTKPTMVKLEEFVTSDMRLISNTQQGSL